MASIILHAKEAVTSFFRYVWQLVSGPPMTNVVFPRLSSRYASMEPSYDVVVVGSGYGGSIAACRSASAGKSVCVLERGKEWLPGEFPEHFLQASEEVQSHFCGKTIPRIGKPYSLYEFYVSSNVTVVQGCGLGGGSLINANVGLDASPDVFHQAPWPKEIKEDLTSLTEVDRDHVVDMLKPTPYPGSFPSLLKLDRMKDGLGGFDIEDMDKLFYKTPLYVTFEDKQKNHVGVPQPKCIGCGNCCGGCNVGSKNTLNLNYLAEAKAYGAHIFTKVEVVAVTQSPDSDEWIVEYKRLVKGSFKVEEQSVRAKHVIISAGALGSTKLLLRSKERGLNVSSQVGKRFSTNGDALAFSYHGQNESNSVGVEVHKIKKQKPPGPCITSVIDLRKTEDTILNKQFVIEDGTPPSVISGIYSTGLHLAAKKLPNPKAIDNTMAFLCMSHDDASGDISYDKNSDNIDIHWEDVGLGENFKIVNEAVEKTSDGMKGKFVKNPIWSDRFGNSVISAHPLGGCAMSASGTSGVVNHAGQVFDGDSDQIMQGLYVMDGAILPTAVGVNPTLTISCIAERCMRLLAKREGWEIDYNFKPIGPEVFKPEKPGIIFTEKMVGKYTLPNNKEESPMEFTLTIESDDVERMTKWDPDHAAEISGTVTCAALSGEPMTVSEGHFELFSTDHEKKNMKEMVYKMVLAADNDRFYSFHGIKKIHKDNFWEIGLTDTTVLFVNIYDGHEFKGDAVGTAVLYITLPNFARQLATLEITHAKSVRERMHWTAAFGSFFSKSIWNVYGPRITGLNHAYFVSSNEPRQKRSLQLLGCSPVLHKVVTKDKFEILLTRYEGGSKGPVVMFHGVGVSSEIFSLDTIQTNLVEYLVANRYDVWLVDWRTSCNLPSMVRKDYTLDDCAAYDYPAAIEEVLEVTKKENVQVLAHCAGSLVFFASLLSGALKGKIRSVVASQVAANPIPAKFNELKAGLYLPGIMENLGVKDLTVDTDDDYASFFDRIFNHFVKGVAHVALPYSQLCSNSVCHRITFIYGLLWEHGNLNELTHDSIHEFFGYVTSKVGSQLALTMRKKKLVSSSDEDIYLPDMNLGLDSDKYKDHIKHLDLPITFIAGEKNRCYVPESTLTTLQLLQEAHPDQHYSREVIPGYGHLDCIFGKDAVRDVYPHMLKALDEQNV